MKWLGLEGIPGDAVPLSVICIVFHFVVFAHVHCCTCTVHRAKIQPSLWNVSFYLEDCIAWDIRKYHCFKKLTVDIFSVFFKSLLPAVAADGKWEGWEVEMVLNFCSLPEGMMQQNQTPAVHLFAFSFPTFISQWWHYWPLLRAATLDSWLTL